MEKNFIIRKILVGRKSWKMSLYLENILKVWGESKEGASWRRPYIEKILKGCGEPKKGDMMMSILRKKI
jgi:hypothetical protein